VGVMTGSTGRVSGRTGGGHWVKIETRPVDPSDYHRVTPVTNVTRQRVVEGEATGIGER